MALVMGPLLRRIASGSFSANTQVNLEEQCNAIPTRWGTVVGLKDNGEKRNKGVVEKSDKKEGV